jgi:dolichol-phosphate mannosyltransferase
MGRVSGLCHAECEAPVGRLGRYGFGSTSTMRVTVVIPALNEAGNIGRLVEETYARVPAEMLAEVIVVDDCSEDGTGSEVKTLMARGAMSGLRYLRHGERSGQSAAMRTGILAASSPVIATMDGDGQNDPADIPRLIARLAPPGTNGPALVGGIRTDRKAEGSKRLASRFANWLRDRVLKDDCPDTGCGIKVYWREAFLRLPYFTSMHRYLPALFITYGHEVAYEPVNDRPRMVGQSKYTNLGRALVGIYDLIGVSWIRRRTKVPPIVEDLPERQHASGMVSRMKRAAEPPRRTGQSELS